MKANILAIDPGTTQSGWCLLRYVTDVVASGVLPNDEMLWRVEDSKADALAIEMIASYGMPVGKETFETCLWIGRFQQAWAYRHDRDLSCVRLVYRNEVKMHLCGTPRAKEANIRQRLIDIFGPVGIKKDPGKLYGVKSHAWSALAVALTAQQTQPCKV